MEAKTLARLRPSDDGSDAIGDALERIASERTALQARAADFEAARMKTLLNGTPQQVSAVEVQLRETQIALEQVDLLEGKLKPRLAAAMIGDKIDQLQAAAASVGETVKAACDWFRSRYPELAAEIVVGLKLCQKAELDWVELRNKVQIATLDPEVRDACPSNILAVGNPARTWIPGRGDMPPHLCVQLPPPQNVEGPAFWWPANLAGRPRGPGM